MKFILAFIAAILFLSSIPDTAKGQPQKGKSVTVTKGRKRSIKRGPRTAATPKPSPVGTTPSGLIYVITRHGEGRQPKPGDTVMVHYTGVLTNGMKFDSSLDTGRPFAFELGAGRVIKGWDEGIAKLHVGDQATLIIPPALGYGPKGIGPIPPDATLIFVVELVGIREKPVSD
ncbi:MAG: FKBP-type peptidyl-prolyl cis-trans isomerase [Acidobacteriota bacterium]|nr:FKBP-type peptidyl-prolyl cis-trans isomerase [Acidobacteriota bacterium]